MENSGRSRFQSKGRGSIPVPRYLIPYLIPHTIDQSTWWGSQIHGGEPIHGGQPTYMRAPGAPTWPPTKAGRLAGQATMYVGCPPCMWASQHVFGFPTMHFDQRYQVSGIRYQVSCILERGWNLDPSIETSIVCFSPNKGPISFHLAHAS